MAVITGAIRRNITPGSNDPTIIPIGIILHVAVSGARSLFDYFLRRSGGIESHFYVRKDGSFEQYRDTDKEADANYRGSSFVRNGKRYGFISIETEGYGDGTWTKEQIATIKFLIGECAKEHPDIKLRRCPGPFDAGIGYHTLFGAPSDWTPVAKSCPGAARKRQFHNIIDPWLNATREGSRVLPRFNPENYFIGAHGAHVEWLGRRLVAHGCDRHHDGDGYQPGRRFTRYDRRNVRDFQTAQGWTGSDADGFPGPETLRRLKADPKPKPAADPEVPEKVAPVAPAKPKPKRATRVQNARESLADAAEQLRRAQQVQGREGWVATTAEKVETILRTGPAR